MVNTATVVASAKAIVVQYHAALVEKMYSLVDVGVGRSGLVKLSLFSFSSSMRSLVVSFLESRCVLGLK